MRVVKVTEYVPARSRLSENIDNVIELLSKMAASASDIAGSRDISYCSGSQ